LPNRVLGRIGNWQGFVELNLGFSLCEDLLSYLGQGVHIRRPGQAWQTAVLVGVSRSIPDVIACDFVTGECLVGDTSLV
jgi:hypothetical protein